MLARPEIRAGFELPPPPKFHKVQVQDRFYTVDDLGHKHYEAGWGYGSKEHGARLDLRMMIQPDVEVYIAAKGLGNQDDVIHRLTYDPNLHVWLDDSPIRQQGKDAITKLDSGTVFEVGKRPDVHIRGISAKGFPLEYAPVPFSRTEITEIVYVDKIKFVEDHESNLDNASSIISRYNHQKERFSGRVASLSETQRETALDISQLHHEDETRLAYAELPGRVVVPQQVVGEARHLYSLTEHNPEVLKERGYKPAQIAAVKESHHTLETGSIVAESRFSGNVYIPPNDVLLGTRAAHNEQILVNHLALDRATQGYKVVGTIHTHPYTPYYVAENYEPLPEMTYPEQRSDVQEMLAYVAYEMWRRISPPSVADLASLIPLRTGEGSEDLTKFHLVAARTKMYAFVPSAGAIPPTPEQYTDWMTTFRDTNHMDKAIAYLSQTISTETLKKVEEVHKEKTKSMYEAYKSSQDADERQKLMDEAVQVLIDELPPEIIEELERQTLRGVISNCEEAYTGLYVADWDPSAPPQDLQLQRIA